MTIKEIAEDANRVATSKGFGGEEVNIDRKLLLAVGELVEAQNCLREGRTPQEKWYREDGKPEGFGPELADVILRVCNLAELLKLDIEALVIEKHNYNKTRPYKHGGKAF